MATAITSASRLEDIEAAFIDNGSYEQQASVPMAQQFIIACRALLLRRPMQAKRATGTGSFSAEWGQQFIKQELDRALQWLSFSPAAQADGGVVFPSFEEARDYDSGTANGSLAEPYGDDTVY